MKYRTQCNQNVLFSLWDYQQSTNNKPSTPFASKKVDLRQGSLKCPHPSPFVQQEAAAELQKLHIFRHDNPATAPTTPSQGHN